MPTTLAQELAEQRARWHVLPGKSAPWAEELLANEFLDAAEQKGRQERRLREALRFANEVIPFHRQRFRRLRLRPGDLDAPDALLRIPAVTRDDVQMNAPAMRNPNIPHEDRHLVTKSSGTTGQPTAVQQSSRSMAMFGRIKQREDRWFRFDPALLMGTIRPKRDLPRGPDGNPIPERLVQHLPGWLYLGHVFRTGACIAYANTNTIDDQVAFLRGEEPHYLTMQAAGLEHVALASQGGFRNLRACLATSQTLSPPMRATVESKLGVPVHQNYGFNEIGLIASRCPEGGRYHVHAEHCLVEIVDADGRPVRGGETGRILVSCLTNGAMPLFRYDCDDFATATEGPCPCGRTLPSFGEIHGRYRRIALLPPGSWKRWAAVQYAFADLPSDLSATLRRYQVHEYLDRSWDLRIHAEGGSIEAMGAFIRPRFEAAADDPPPLRIIATDRFEGSPDRKFQDYWSDFVPSPEAVGPDRGQPG